ncbi:MAG: HTH domain-containing protein [Candidatus Helarchaeota archaeon]|nr:HTH domain-containing protein [Candidatus Helarchaeota archaeon]
MGLKQNIKDEILGVLINSRFGMNITKIAEKLKISRTTVTKYLKSLENEGLAVVQDVGQYKLWIHKDIYLEEKNKGKQLQNFIIPLYITMLKNFEKIGVGPEEIKGLGKSTAKDFNFVDFSDSRVFDFVKEMQISYDNFKPDELARFFMNVIDSVARWFDNYVWKPPIIIDGTRIIILRMENSDYIDAPMHFYLISGVMEEELNNYISGKVTINQIATEEKVVDFKFDLSGPPP